MKFNESNDIMNIRLTLQFDGTDYHGWQIQPGKPTIQGALRDALRIITREDINPIGCGRTDAGVHAEEYTASFRTDSSIPVDRIPFALNANLPQDIVCRGAEAADDDFSANKSAAAKCYRYTIDNGMFPDVFLSRYAWHVKYELDTERMRRAAEAFLGTHDFIGFASSGFSVKTTVRTIYGIEIAKSNNIITADVTGNGFLYNMVRIIAGTLVYAGSGRIDPAEMPEIIESRRRERAGITAPAKGLCLRKVFY